LIIKYPIQNFDIYSYLSLIFETNKKTKMENKNLSQDVIEKLVEFRQYLSGQRYSESTIKTYNLMLEHFFSYHNNLKPEEVCLADIKKFNYDYILKNGLSISFQNQFINAIKKFYEKVYNQNT